MRLGMLRRHPELPKDRVEEVAIAATTQIGDLVAYLETL